MKYFNYPVNGRMYKFGLFCQGHPEDRAQERGPKCSWALIGETIRAGLPEVVKIATQNKDLILVNEVSGHSVVLKLRLEKNVFIMIVKTVINEGKNLWVSKKNAQKSVIVRVNAV